MASLGDRFTILCLGDSLTEQGFGAAGCGQGWAARLADAYRRRADVLSRGLGGYTTRTFAPVCAAVLAAARSSGQRFLLTTLCLGANDANADAGIRIPAQNVPLPEYRAHLARMLTDAASVSDCVVCIAPPPVDNTRWLERSNAAVAAYTAAAEGAVADARGALGGGACVLLFVPMLTAFTGGVACGEVGGSGGAPPPWLPLLSDGLHLSDAGNARFADALMGALRAGFPAGAPGEGAPTVDTCADYPHWSAVPQGDAAEAAAALSGDALRAWRGARR